MAEALHIVLNGEEKTIPIPGKHQNNAELFRDGFISVFTGAVDLYVSLNAEETAAWAAGVHAARSMD